MASLMTTPFRHVSTARCIKLNQENMGPQHKLRIANILMGLGIAPLVLYLAWAAPIFRSSDSGQQPTIFMLDPIAMIGLLVMTFTVAVLMAGSSALWSRSLTARHVEMRSRSATLMRIGVVLALCAPLLLAI